MFYLKITSLLLVVFLVQCSTEDTSVTQATKGPSEPSTAGAGKVATYIPNPLKKCSYETSWTDVDTFSLESDQAAYPRSIGFSPSGSVYVGGFAYSSSQTGSLAVVRKLAYGESEFSTLDSYSYEEDNATKVSSIISGTSGLPVFTVNQNTGATGGKSRGVTRMVDETLTAENLHDEVYTQEGYNSELTDIARDENGTLYSVGWGFGVSPTRHDGFFRISSDGGATWETKSFTYSDSSTTNRLDYVAVIRGEVYVTGLAGGEGNCSNNTAFIAKTADQGDSWTILDTYCKEASTAAYPSSKPFMDAAGNLYHQVHTATDGKVWIIRKSSDNGETWSTANEYQHTSSRNSQGYQMIQGYDGVIYAAGYGLNTSHFAYAVILKSSDFGTTWELSEATQLEENYSALYYDIATDPDGHLWSVMSASTSAGSNKWYTRRKLCE